jgi:hypothetical protein
MTRKMIPVEESIAEWRKDPEYVKAYDALESEFSLAAVIIQARAHAGLTQEQLAERMHTTQAVIARLESGRANPRRVLSNAWPQRPACACGSLWSRRRRGESWPISGAVIRSEPRAGGRTA